MQAVLQNAAFSEDLPLDKIARSVSTLIQDSDLLLSASSLHVGVVLLRSYNNAGQSVSECMLPKALQLAGSALLQVCYTRASISQLYTRKLRQEVMFQCAFSSYISISVETIRPLLLRLCSHDWLANCPTLKWSLASNSLDPWMFHIVTVTYVTDPPTIGAGHSDECASGVPSHHLWLPDTRSHLSQHHRYIIGASK